jgi:hypothetical protein
MAKKLRNNSPSEITSVITYGNKVQPQQVIWMKDEDATFALTLTYKDGANATQNYFAVVSDATAHQHDVREGFALTGDVLNDQDQMKLDSFLKKNEFPSPVSGAGVDGSLTVAGVTFYPTADMTAAAMLALSPSTYQGRVVRVTDLNKALFESNGTRWKPVNGRAVIATLDTDWTGVTGTAEQIAFQKLIQGGIIKNGDALLFSGGFGKSGTAETTTIQIRVGSTGTTADTSILTTAPLATTNVTHGMYLEFRRQSATSLQRGMNGATQNPFGASSAARGSATTLASSLDSVAQYITLTMTQSSTAETPSAWGFRVELITSAA